MFCRLMSLTFITLLLSLALSTFAAPIGTDVEASDATSLTTRTTHDGRGTYFYPGLGNCGKWNDDNDAIIAVSTQIYHDGENCDQWVHITNQDNGKTTYALVRDSCPSCAAGSLDMSPAVFKKLAPLEQGVIPIEWHYMQRGWSP